MNFRKNLKGEKVWLLIQKTRFESFWLLTFGFYFFPKWPPQMFHHSESIKLQLSVFLSLPKFCCFIASITCLGNCYWTSFILEKVLAPGMQGDDERCAGKWGICPFLALMSEVPIPGGEKGKTWGRGKYIPMFFFPARYCSQDKSCSVKWRLSRWRLCDPLESLRAQNVS